MPDTLLKNVKKEFLARLISEYHGSFPLGMAQDMEPLKDGAMNTAFRASADKIQALFNRLTVPDSWAAITDEQVEEALRNYYQLQKLIEQYINKFPAEMAAFQEERGDDLFHPLIRLRENLKILTIVAHTNLNYAQEVPPNEAATLLNDKSFDSNQYTLSFHASLGEWYYQKSKKGQMAEAAGGAGEVFFGHQLKNNTNETIRQLLANNPEALAAGKSICIKTPTEEAIKRNLAQTPEFLALQIAGLNPKMIPESQILIMDKATGQDLDAFLHLTSISTDNKNKIIVNALDALIRLHQNGILHRDIKLANMIVNQDSYEVTFVDFGLSLSMELMDNITNKEFLNKAINCLTHPETLESMEASEDKTEILRLGKNPVIAKIMANIETLRVLLDSKDNLAKIQNDLNRLNNTKLQKLGMRQELINNLTDEKFLSQFPPEIARKFTQLSQIKGRDEVFDLTSEIEDLLYLRERQLGNEITNQLFMENKIQANLSSAQNTKEVTTNNLNYARGMTPAYMPPQLDTTHLNCTQDLYSLGLAFAYLELEDTNISSYIPKEMDFPQVLNEAVKNDLEKLRQDAPKDDVFLQQRIDLILKMIEADPQKRLSTAEIIEHLTHFKNAISWNVSQSPVAHSWKNQHNPNLTIHPPRDSLDSPRSSESLSSTSPKSGKKLFDRLMSHLPGSPTRREDSSSGGESPKGESSSRKGSFGKRGNA